MDEKQCKTAVNTRYLQVIKTVPNYSLFLKNFCFLALDKLISARTCHIFINSKK